jgi:hypothetical protein
MPSPKTIGIVGSRRRDGLDDLSRTCLAFDKLYKNGDEIVSGGCPRGGDRFAEIIARQYGCSITIHFPDWGRLGKIAGLERNTKIVRDCDILIAVVVSDRKGGTEDSVRKAIKLGKPVIYV